MPALFRYRASTAIVCGLMGWAAFYRAVGEETPSPTAEFAAAASRARDEDLEFFEKQVRPLLVSRCHECHAGDDPKGNLRLDSRAAALVGGDTGPAIVPSNPDESLLVDAIRYGDTYQMPPKSKLPAEEIGVLTRWVEMGAPWPTEVGADSGAEGGGKTEKVRFDLAQRKAAHWAWQPVQAVDPPPVHQAQWPATDVDRFVLAKLEANGLGPAPPADRRTLVRRLYFDLIGLPPNPAEVDAFLADKSADALPRLVDRLLDSPRFGERWARHWLDMVRYAESLGHEYDYTLPNAWRYRDYVIRALNADVPYDQFVVEHLAGDLLEQPRLHPDAGFNESILGTGFWFLGEELHSPVDIRQDEMDRLDNRIDVMSKTFLGLTVACARCHDHKFDAISQRDYYALAGYLISSSYRQVRFESIEAEQRAASEIEQLRAETTRQLRRCLADAERPALARTAEYLQSARQALLDPAKTSADTPDTGSTLAAWTAELKSATANLRHPLHPLSLLALPASEAGARWQTLRDEFRRELNRGGPLPEKSEVIVDYADTAASWYQDGLTFGLHPRQAGDLRLLSPSEITLSSPSILPGVSFVTRGCAERDPAFARPDCAPGDLPRETTFGSWDRAGRVLRTPEFTLGSGRLWYLVRGSVRVYAAVNSHKLIAGPLHGALLMESKGDPQAWRWVSHNLADYAGHRAHIEFSPADADDVAIAQVVDAPTEPALDAGLNPLVAALVDEVEPPAFESLAERYQQLFVSVTESGSAEDRTIGAADRSAEAQLASWLYEHPAFWAREGDSALAAAKDALGQFLAKQAACLARLPATSAAAIALLDGNGVDEQLLIRGNSRTPADAVPRRLLEAIAGGTSGGSAAGSGRLELARAVVAADNPLTARVMVNRVWHHLFGQGIVGSVDNFGVMGQPPSHPELLDYLATQFVREGWSLKRLIRTLVLSQTYQMSSRPNQGDAQDPQDLLLHRMRIRRLEGEAIRDAMLAASGRLDPTMFGPGVPIYLTAQMEGRGKPAQGSLDGNGRRSVYLAIRRNFLSPFMLAFDMPIPFSTVGRRNVSNVPAQALSLMNDPFVVQQATACARRLLAEGPADSTQRVRWIYQTLLGRLPEPHEEELAADFLTRQGRELGLSPADGVNDVRLWADLTQALFNSKEFIFVP